MRLKITTTLLFALFINLAFSQTTKNLSLKEAVEIALKQSNEASLASTKVASSKLELESTKSNQYPSLKISGQYLQLTNASVEGNLFSNNNSGANPSSSSGSPSPSSLLLGQASVNMPIFSGFKLKNSIIASENLYKSQTYYAAHTKEKIALEVTELFAQLYQSQQMVKLFEENIKSANQRVTDFNNLMENGLLAKNDLLKSQLQVSTIQLALDNAKKNSNVINYKLVKLLQLEENTKISIDIATIQKEMVENQMQDNKGTRNDLLAVDYQIKASEAAIKVAKSNYFPSIALTGGYIAFDLKDVIKVNNAMNYGIGISYDVSSIFKNSSAVKLAKSKSEEAKITSKILTDKISEDVQSADENYKLSQKQSEVYKESLLQSSENYRILKDKYDNGLSNTNDLLEADVQELQSKINIALSQADIALKFYELQFAKGNLIQSLNIAQ